MSSYKVSQESTRTSRWFGAAVAVLSVAVASCGASDGGATPDDGPGDDVAVETSPADAVEPTVAPEPTDDAVATTEPVDSVIATDPPITELPTSEPAEPLAASGAVSGTCAYEFVEQNDLGAVINQQCSFAPESASALPSQFEQQFTQYSEVAGTTTTAGGAGVFLGGGDDGFVLAGTTRDGNAHIVAVTDGVREYEGSTAHVFALSPADPDGAFTMNWFVGTEPVFTPAVDGETALVAFECAIVGDVESCTYSGADDRFVPAADERVLTGVEPEGMTDPVDGVSMFTSAATNGAVRAGLADDNGIRRFVGFRDGVGEIEGQLVEEEGWGQVDGDRFSGSIRMRIVTA